MRYWLDCEFIERGHKHPIDLISIGIVAEDDRELYLLDWECDHSKASEWVKQNVLATLPKKTKENYGYHNEIVGKYCGRISLAQRIEEFCSPSKYGSPEFWAYYADYDWVVFAQIFGTMMDLPKGFPMYCRDIKQECDRLGNPELPKQESGEHNALADARWNRKAWEFLKDSGMVED